MAQMWAYCDPCGRWFYPESPRNGSVTTPTCPVCSTEADRLAEEPGTRS